MKFFKAVLNFVSKNDNRKGSWSDQDFVLERDVKMKFYIFAAESDWFRFISFFLVHFKQGP